MWYNTLNGYAYKSVALLPTLRSEGGFTDIMKKRILAFVLCVVMLVPLFSSCSGGLVESIMQVYLSHQVYDLDPLNAMTNDAQLKIVSLIFAGLYKLDDNGRVQDDLAAKTEVINKEDKGEYTLRITLKETSWSDGSAVSSDDVVYTFKRVLKARNSNAATAMLMKIENAKEVKEGKVSIDRLGVTAPETDVVEISFTEFITDELLEEFKLSLTSPALFPLRETYVEGKPDWAKKPSSIVCSGPFILRKASYDGGQVILERNEYYFRNREKDSEDKYVTPYRLVINYGVEAEQQLELYESGQVVFVGEIPLSKREEYKSKVTLVDTLSTHTYYFNQNATVYNKGYNDEIIKYITDIYANTNDSVYKKYDTALKAWNEWQNKFKEEVTLPYPELPTQPTTVLGYYTEADIAAFKESVAEYNAAVEAFKTEYAIMRLEAELPPTIPAVPEPAKQVKLFADANVRKALSLVIDREAIAASVVYAKPATGLLNNKIFYASSADKTFRSQGGVISTTKDLATAQSLLAASGITASDYSFAIRVRAADEVHVKIAEQVAAAWGELGFDVTVEPIDVKVNEDIDPSTKEVVSDIRDDLFDEQVVNAGNYQVMAFDLVAESPSAFSVLAPYALNYTGNATVSGAVKVQNPHQTGYNSEAYNELIERAFNAESADERAELLLEAEKLLVDTDAAVMPVLFNQTAHMIGSELNARSLSQSYYGYFYFNKANLKGWEDYRESYFPETSEEPEDEEQPSDEPVDEVGGGDPE